MRYVSDLQSIVQGGKIQAKYDTTFKFLNKSLKNTGLAILLTGSSIFSNYSNLLADTIPKAPMMQTDTIQKKPLYNEHSYILAGELKNLNFDNPMSVAGINLELPDTCSAWNLIKSLDTLTIRTKVNISESESLNITQNNASSSTDIDTTINHTSKEPRNLEEFSKIFELAVNYTIREYSKVAPFPITKIPEKINIRIYRENDTIYGSYTTVIDLIKFNDYYFKYSLDANIFAIFGIIDHETVHLLFQLNNPMQKRVDALTDRYDALLALGFPLDRNKTMPLLKQYENGEGKNFYGALIELALPLNREEIEEYLKLDEKCEKDTEKEAYAFESSVFKTLFNGILEDSGAAINFNDSYLNKSSSDTSVNDSQYRDYLRSNITEASNAFPVLNERMLEICLGMYNHINDRIETARKKYLPEQEINWNKYKRHDFQDIFINFLKK